jgi:uncharacterized protein
MRRVVLDTNVMVSAYLGGELETIIVSWRAGDFTLIVSNSIVSEYLDVLKRPKFKIEQDELDDFAALILSKAEFVLPDKSIRAVKADPSDNKFLEAAARERLKALREGRDQESVDRLLGKLAEAAKGTENVMPLFVECVENDITLG